MSPLLSQRSQTVMQSYIRAMTRACAQAGGINMAQGVCDLDIPQCVVQGAHEAMLNGHNTYTACEGTAVLRKAIAGKMQRFYSMSVDPNTEVMVSAGATGAFYAAGMALLNPGDHVIVLEPFYGYHVSTLAALGCTSIPVRLTGPDWNLDIAVLEQALTPATRALVINTPCNPSGKVFSRADLILLADFTTRNDLILFSDEIYEHFVYDGLVHTPPASLPELRPRTVTISGFSKVFSMTGWRLGYAIAPPEVIHAAAQFNDLFYVCAPTPLQYGAAAGLAQLGPDYYDKIAQEHCDKRNQFCDALVRAGLTPQVPSGSYYVLADTSAVPGSDDLAKAMHLLDKTGIAGVPGRAFYHDNSGENLIRFCFAKKQPILERACEQIAAFKQV